MNPYTCTIQGDISRADAVGLWNLCLGRRVVEFGVGASTSILSHCASRLDCFDTSEEWIRKTRARVIPGGVPPSFTRFTEIPDAPECDVLWIDGKPSERLAFTLRNFDRAREMVILHGALRHKHSIGHTILNDILSAHWESIQTVEIGYLESHLLVLRKRKRPLRYYNYHFTEAHNHRLEP